jgi:hypothetical protein
MQRSAKKAYARLVNKFRGTVLGVLVVVCGVCVLPPAVALAGTVDQQQTSSNTNTGLFSAQHAAQTFTAGISGVVDQVDLSLLKVGTPPASVTVEIRNTSAGNPGTAVLATASLPTSAIGPSPGSFIPVTFAAPALVAAGTQYAVVAYSPGAAGNAVGWNYQNTGNPYLPGGMFSSSDPIPPGGNWSNAGLVNADLGFKTYVGPAPPLVDKTPPETLIGSKKIKGTTAKFTFSSSEPGSTFQCKLDKHSFKPCSSPKKYKHLSAGKHKFKVRAVDAAGNVDASAAKKKFKI